MTSFSGRSEWTFGLPALLDLFDGDRDALGGLLEAAIGSIARDVGQIEAAITAGEQAGLAGVAHRLKGTSGTIDARRVFAAATALEGAARDGPGALAALAAELRLAFGEVESDVAAYFAAN